MANEKKAVCGGFLIGDGLQMDGKVLSAESNQTTIIYDIDFGATFTDLIDYPIDSRKVCEEVKSGKNVILRCKVGQYVYQLVPAQIDPELYAGQVMFYLTTYSRNKVVASYQLNAQSMMNAYWAYYAKYTLT